MLSVAPTLARYFQISGTDGNYEPAWEEIFTANDSTIDGRVSRNQESVNHSLGKHVMLSAVKYLLWTGELETRDSSLHSE